MRPCPHGIGICEQCNVEKEALHNLLVECLREGRSGGWTQGSPLDFKISKAVGEPPEYDTSLPRVFKHPDGTMTVMIDGLGDMIDLRHCIHCGRLYLTWGCMSDMTCWGCKLAKARADAEGTSPCPTPTTTSHT